MQPDPDLRPGTILQIQPRADRYCGQFCVFVEARLNGVEAKVYIKVRDGVVYMTYGWQDLALTGGRAVWRPDATLSGKARVPPGRRPVTVAAPLQTPTPTEPPPPSPPPLTPAPARRWQALDEALPELARRQAHG